MTEVSPPSHAEPQELALAAEFDTPTRADWRKLVTAVLRRSGALPEDLLAGSSTGTEGGETTSPESLLASRTYDGIELRPLYTREDTADLASAGFPGLPPFVRGDRPEGKVAAGWDCRPLHTDPHAVATNTAVLADLANGANSVWLPVGGSALPIESLADALNGVYVDLAPVVLDAGSDYAAAADALLEVFADREIAPSEVIGTIGADPIGSRARTGQAHDIAPAAELAARLSAQYPQLRTIVVDALPFHDAGGSDSQELGASIACGVAYLRALTDAGLSVEAAAAQLEFRYAATADQFLTIAKLRAARRLWSRVCGASGAPWAGAQRQHAVTSSAMLTKRDPWVNMLRATVACFGAAVGGADAITVRPFDAAIGLPDAFSRRVARNTSAILAEESKLAGVIDPAGGSWYVENLTEALAHAAWREFQTIEDEGGIEASLASGGIATRLDATWQARSARLATRQDAITGVSEFPMLAELPVERPAAPAEPDGGGLPRIRYAQAYEELRDRSDAHLAEHGVRPRVFLATLGPVAAHTARAGFAANLFAAGGIEPVNAGPTSAVADVLAGYLHSKTSVACLCGTDLAYAEQAEDVAAALRKAGAKAVLLAGKPSDAYDGVTGFVHAGCDALDVLTTTLQTLGVTDGDS
ncbi:MAG: methylmalonyl-CoA mutase family protein [Haloechinothrix sp.]